MSREVNIDKELQLDLMRKLEALESSTDLEGTAIISKTGLRIASASTSETEADLHSAGPAALISLGEKLSLGLEYGELTEIVIKGAAGYSILTVGSPIEGEVSNFMLISHSSKGFKLGYYFHRLRKAYVEIRSLLEDIEIGSANY